MSLKKSALAKAKKIATKKPKPAEAPKPGPVTPVRKVVKQTELELVDRPKPGRKAIAAEDKRIGLSFYVKRADWDAAYQCGYAALKAAGFVL